MPSPRVDVAGLGTAIGSVPQQLLNGHVVGGLGTSVDASGVSDRGILLVKAVCQNPPSCLCTPQISPLQGAQAVLIADDIVISGPASPAAVSVTMHLILDGTISIDAPGFWGSRLQLNISVPGGGGSGLLAFNGSGDFFAFGLLSGYGPGPGPRAINLNMNVPVNQPFGMNAIIAASVVGTSLGNATHTAICNFFDGGGLHFPAAGLVSTIAGPIHVSGGAAPAFGLPAGYTADSPTLNIANNAWQGQLPTGAAKTSWGRLKSLYR